ncbi:hypothetical protein AB833_07175 [Chromatiales bacterium (ex Bugula neritina AB1)]|nr:hypothetical protein AB833_07175 [Chromatiales bacterium (ex Bugula neritina AB1)]
MLLYRDCDQASLHTLLAALGLQVVHVDAAAAIPGSFWGDEEAGLIGATLYLRDDTPVHSVLHESCHFACMDESRRAELHTNAGGDSAEENAVCYLQILLSDVLPDMGRARMFNDMDTWGYSFRLGSSRRWFEEDADDAKSWLAHKQLLAMADQLTHTNR